MGRVLTVLLAVVVCSFASIAYARAPDTFEEDYHPPIIIDTPQWFAFELRFGPYKPNLRSRKTTFDNDAGWLLNLEPEFTVYHIPYNIGQLNLAGVFGWAKYDAYARDTMNPDVRTGEKNKFVIFPMSLLGVVRIDAIARHTVVPLTFAAKAGYEWVRWKTSTGEGPKVKGFNHGFRYGFQAALELDFLNRDAARSLDEDFGFNHTYIFYEFMDSKTKGTGASANMFGIGAVF